MADVIAPGREPSGPVKGLAVVLTVMNLTIVVVLAASLAVSLVSLDGLDADGAVVYLAVIGLLLACTVVGRWGLARHPVVALLVMGVPGVLVTLLLIVSLVFAALTIGRMEKEMNRTDRPPSFGP